MAEACTYGCTVCGGQSGGPHTPGCCRGGACNSPPRQRYGYEEKQREIAALTEEQKAERRARARAMRAEKTQFRRWLLAEKKWRQAEMERRYLARIAERERQREEAAIRARQPQVRVNYTPVSEVPATANEVRVRSRKQEA